MNTPGVLSRSPKSKLLIPIPPIPSIPAISAEHELERSRPSSTRGEEPIVRLGRDVVDGPSLDEDGPVDVDELDVDVDVSNEGRESRGKGRSVGLPRLEEDGESGVLVEYDIVDGVDIVDFEGLEMDPLPWSNLDRFAALSDVFSRNVGSEKVSP